jgi:thiamine biosynthesis lipoprotein
LTASTSFPLWGGVAVVAVTEPDRMSVARDAVLRTVDAFDRACSSFRSDSELSALNRAAGRATPVSPLLMEAVSCALRAAELSDGDVDPGLGHALEALGFVPSATPRLAFLVRAGWRAVSLDAAAGTIRLPAGVSLDLGATAKALAADRAAEAASMQAGCGALVALAGDLATAGPAPAGGWPIRVTDDHRQAEAPGQTVSIEGGGLATSSTQVRRRDGNGGGVVHHLLDPTTGRPVEGGGWRTVSVAAASCLDANTAATAAIVRGPRAVDWLRASELPARLVSSEGTVLHVAGWPADDDDLPRLEPSTAGVAA